ncbi:MAG: uracil-DNA glycosylase family protein [Isosphaeraceae bacterium]
MRTIQGLIEAVEAEARRSPFPVDTPVYTKAGRAPLVPVLFAGSLDAPVCVIGRDLGRDAVAAGQPLIGAGGRLVRAGFYRAIHGRDAPTPAIDRGLESVLEHVLLTNTVPFKPPGNKAYSSQVRERFRPFLAELLVAHWKGNRVITLGNEAFHWFEPYVDDPAALATFWAKEDRYESSLRCRVFFEHAGGRSGRELVVEPLPHPSPLNARWYGLFPGLLAGRLESAGLGT